jgi:hypothetical protein
MKTLKILLLSIICFSLQGCPGEGEEDVPDNFFNIQNNFNEDIYVYYEILDTELLPIRYPVVPSIKIIQTGKYREAYKNVFFDGGKKLWILVFKKSTLENNTWQAIKDQGLYDKRYDLTLEQLKALNYEIVYTGL